MARQVRVEIIGDARRLRSAFGDAERHTVRFGTTLGRFSGVAIRAFGGVGVAAAGLGAAAAFMGIKTEAGLEQATIGFTQLLGSGRKAQAFLAQLKAFAAKTPFELPGLIDAARGLVGAGTAAKNVIPILTALGDASGALGLDQERFGRVMIAVTQIMNKGKLQAEELMQITEAGIPVWPLLANAMHKPVPELQKMMQHGDLLAKDVLPKLFDQMHKDYGGSMAKQSQTLSGLWSTFMDTINIGLADAIKPLEGELKTGLKGAIDIAAGALKGVADFMTNTVVPSLKTAKKWWTDNKDIVSDFAGILTTLFSPAASDAKESTDDLRTSQEKLYDAFSSGLEAGLRLAQGFIALARLAGNVSKVFIDLVGGAGHLVNAVDRITGGSGKAGNAMIDWARDMREKTLVQLGKLEEQAKETQAAIDRLHGRRIDVQASLRLGFTKSFTQKDWVDVRLAAGRMAEGGLVRGPGGPTADTIPALLSSGEFVVNAAAVRQLGVEKLKRLNAIRFAAGGPVGAIDAETGSINRVQAGGTGWLMNRGINKIMGSFGGAGGSADVSSVARWTAAVLGRFAEWGAWARRIMFESGGNWSAVNRTDINWRLGHPSVGGAQVIRGTFQRWANGFRGVGPFLYGVSINPRANSFAGANYAIHRYGSLAAVDPRIRPIGYDSGGLLPPGLSLSWNGTGRPEPVGYGGVTLERGAIQVYGAPGMDERRLAQLTGQAVAAALDARDRRAAQGKRA